MSVGVIAWRNSMRGLRSMPCAASRSRRGVAGAWRFTAAGKGKPALVFTPAEADGSSQRVLAAVDAQLDDGQVAAGKFRSDGQAGVLTLRDE